MATMRQGAWSIAVFVVWCLASSARAADPDSLIREGIDLRRQGDDAAALEKFKQAHAIRADPRSLAQVGLAEQALGLWSPAYSHLHDALGVTGDGWIQKNRQVLEEALNVINGHLGALEIVGEPKGATVRIDGQAVGTLPLPAPLRLGVGTVVVAVAAAGYVTISRPVQINQGTSARERFVLQMLPTTETPPSTTSAAPDRPAVVAPPAPDNGDRPIDRRLILAGAIAAGGLGSLVWGGIETAIWQHRVSTFNGREDCWNTVPANWSQSCADIHEQGQHAKYLAIAGYGIGAGLLATSAVVFFTRPVQSTEVAFSCLPETTAARVGVNCHVQF